MCRLQPQPTTIIGRDDTTNRNDHSSSTSTTTTTTTPRSFLRKLFSSLFPIPPYVLIILLPFLPTSLYLNRGYTVWFHLLSLSYPFTRSPFTRKVLILQGTGICLGWYAAILNDWFADGTFCHTLYRNMPGGMLEYMVIEEAGLGEGGSYSMLTARSSYAMRMASHAVDTAGHPGLLYLFWRLHSNSNSKSNDDTNDAAGGAGNGGTARDVLTWPVIVFAWNFSRLWSAVHSYYNTGELKIWYFGHDVYLLSNLDAYLFAYAAEGACFVAAIAFRLYWDYYCEDREMASSSSASASSSYSATTNVGERKRYETVSAGRSDGMPELIHSASAASAGSVP